MSSTTRYETDFYAWTREQAELLRREEFEQLDLSHLIEELEDMSSSTRRELVNRLALLLAHLLKWEYQPEKRTRSWLSTIRVQRRSINELLSDNPSLRTRLEDSIEKAYANAIDQAWAETGLDETAFPPVCHYTSYQILDETFFPDKSP
jgi:hypothetical protein